MKSNEEILLSFGVKPTAIRLLVYRTSANLDTAFSLGELEELLDTVDRSTIFRTLTTFVEHSILHTIDDGNGHKKYCFCTQDNKTDSIHQQCQHIHFTCRECGRTFCFESEHIPSAPLPEGYETEQINYLVKGVCSDCK